ncbi:M23 family metallopeptidase [Microbacterium sp. BH-3-3-3]|uniref:M23 family metallopeptidase n=1 Tax=Microbacterium sp. BH-3-3-3 TaxID=1906742 RepID=UPI0011A6E18A|nr:M23 family metallopeptidase [Microbacterium sp. BH-3-3-3]
MPNLNDAFGWIEDIKREIARLKSGAFLENSSITQGRMRFIGGLLKLDSGATLDGEGTFIWRGAGSIAGDFEVLEGGVIKVGGVLISPIGGGRIMIGAGPNGIILDAATGSLTNGNVTIEGGKATFGVGSAQVVIDGATGMITAGTGAAKVTIDGATGKVVLGALTLDPTTDGGAALFSNGSKLFSNLLAIGLKNSFGEMTIGALASLLSFGDNHVSVGPTGISLAGVRAVDSTDGVKWLGILDSGEIVKVSPSVGGPGSRLSWPFPPSMVTSEYGPRDSPGEGASTFHEGIDFGAAEGTPIPSAGSGVVEFAGESGGFGNCVVINHGGGLKTRYAHMQTLPAVTVGQTVTRGQALGPVGNTGVSFGAHLHFEVEVDGVKVNPRTKLPAS